MSEVAIYYQNPRLDYLFGMISGTPIPTKQDKFKPIELVEVDDVGNETILNDFYRKKPGPDALVEFQRLIHEQAQQALGSERIIMMPQTVEVVLAISVTEKRFKEVDVDNLAKAVLDSLKGAIFEDDSQVSSLVCSKYIHPFKMNGIWVGITKITAQNEGFASEIKLYSRSEWKR